MDHHSGHSGHGGMDMPLPADETCSMNMLFTLSTHNLCIIFPSWRITGPVSLFLSLLAIVALTAGYEAVRELSRRYEAATARWGGYGEERDKDRERDREAGRDGGGGGTGGYSDRARARTPTPNPVLNGGGPISNATRRRGRKTVRAALYALQVFYSFFIMLLFMTYNGWVMLAVAVGAFVGFMMFGSNGGGSSTKSVACH